MFVIPPTSSVLQSCFSSVMESQRSLMPQIHCYTTLCENLQPLFICILLPRRGTLLKLLRWSWAIALQIFWRSLKKKFFFGHWFIFHSLSLLNDWSIKYALKSMDQPLLCFYITVKVAKNRLYISLYGRGLAMNLTGPHKSQMTWPPNSPDPDWIKHPWNVPQPTFCRKEMFGSHHVEQ